MITVFIIRKTSIIGNIDDHERDVMGYIIEWNTMKEAIDYLINKECDRYYYKIEEVYKLNK